MVTKVTANEFALVKIGKQVTKTTEWKEATELVPTMKEGDIAKVALPEVARKKIGGKHPVQKFRAALALWCKSKGHKMDVIRVEEEIYFTPKAAKKDQAQAKVA